MTRWASGTEPPRKLKISVSKLFADHRLEKSLPVVHLRQAPQCSPKSMPSLRDLAGPVDAQPNGQWRCMALACAVSTALHIAIWARWRGSSPEPVARPPQTIEVSLITIPSLSVSQPQQTTGVNPSEINKVGNLPPSPQPRQTRAQDLAEPHRPANKPPQKLIPRKVAKPRPRSARRPSEQPGPLSEAGSDIATAAAPSSGPAGEGSQTPSPGGPHAPQPVPFVEAVFRSASLRNPPTQYPRLAIEHQWEGRVILRVQVLINGLAGQIHIEQGSGHPLLDDAAVQQVKTWHFIPARKGDQPVDSWVKVPVEFRLKR